MTTPTPTPLRLLLLHGYTQSPSLFHAKTRALHKALQKAFPPALYALHLAYPCAPHRLAGADIPGYEPDPALDAPPEAYGWWRRKDDGDGAGGVVYEGLERGLDVIAECVRREGPFDGVVGFSQGAAAAAMVASLLEGQGRREVFERDCAAAAGGGAGGGGMPFPRSFLGEQGHGFVQGALKFAVCYSGFRAPGGRYARFYEPRIRTPVLHVLGQVDVVVDEGRGRELVRACEEGEKRVVVHPGGHFVPSQKPWLDAVVGFVKGCVEGGEEGKKKAEEKKEEVSAQDMDVPF